MLDRKQIIFTWLVLVFALSSAAAPLRVGIDVNGEPMTFVDAKGVPTGFAVEIMDSIAREMHFEVVYTVKPWTDMMEDFKTGRLDALANITYTTQRTAFIDYTVPHLVMKGGVFVRKGDTSIKTAADLRTRRIAIKVTSSPYSYLESHGWLGEVVPVSGLREALHAVADGRADATIDARIIGVKNFRDERLALESPDIDVPEFAQQTHIGLHRGDAERLALINEGLARLHTNGVYDRIYEKWISPLEPRQLRLKDVQPYLLPGSLVLALILGALVWQRRLLNRLARQAAALHQSEKQLTLVLEGSENGFWDWDMHTNRVERSERWASMLGYTLADIPALLEDGSALVHPEDLPILLDLRRRRIAGIQNAHAEYRMRAKSGEWRWILNRGKVVERAPDGTPLRMAGTHTDITDLKRTREELVRQEAQFRFIFKNLPVGISWLNHREAETRVVNPAHERITGVPADKSRHTAHYVAATHPDDRDRQKAFEDQLYAGAIDHFSMEKRYVRPDGRLVWALLTMHLYTDPISGAVQQVTTLVDIDELKRAEAERETFRLKMIETQKLESLGVLAGGIAHDFNNLLTVILGNATLARGERDGADDERLKQIELAAHRAADLCRQMLAYAGKGSFQIQRLDLGALVRDTAQLLSVSISKKTRVLIHLPPGLPAVSGDASQLRQVVMNLVINASEAQGDQPGEIRITSRMARPQPPAAGAIHTFDLPPGDCVCLEVADTGQGMSPATIARIFDPFFTTKFAGRGLGLAAVLGIVRAHHGALTVESTLGRGTTFRLFLPVATADLTSPASTGSAPPIPYSGSGVILIADDEPAVRAAADTIFRRHGYTTILAGDGNEAVRLFRENFQKITAVLLDLTMPGLDGAEALRAIRAIQPTARVLVTSGYSEQDVTDRLRGLGAFGILRKPFTQDMLLSRIAKVIAT